MLRSIIQHLRFPFSILLLPVFLFAIAELNKESIHLSTMLLLFCILHLLVYPSSNAYNSLQDNDKGSIGLIKNPLPVASELKWVSILFDLSAILLSMTINFYTAMAVAIYILFSRLYSYRKIRLKKYPVIGFLTVFIFQGYWIYMLVQFAVGGITIIHSYALGLCASCLIGAVYPLSQIYQHQQDKADGVTSISYLLGYKGTFIFSGILYTIGSAIYLSMHALDGNLNNILIFMGCQFPVILFFLYWFYKVWQDKSEANFKNTMRMNLISAICMNACFVILYFCK